jgi:hypothetical protein
VDKILDGVQFNLDNNEATPTVIFDQHDPTYKRLELKRIEWPEDFCNTAPCELMVLCGRDSSNVA